MESDIEGWSFAQQLLVGAGHRRRPAPREKLRVIASGLSRTGTVSLKKALNDRYDIHCLHTVDIIRYGMQNDVALAVPPTDPDELALRMLVKKILYLGYDCVIDILWPFGPRLAALHPEANIVHAERSSPEAWYKSWSSIEGCFLVIGTRPYRWISDFWWHIESVRQNTNFTRYATPGYDTIMSHPLPWVDVLTLSEDTNHREWLQLYHSHRERMNATGNPFLLYHLSDGYAPLDGFFGVNTTGLPDARLTPLPRLNSGGNFDRVRRGLMVPCFVYPLPMILWTLCLIRCLRRRARKRGLYSFDAPTRILMSEEEEEEKA